MGGPAQCSLFPPAAPGQTAWFIDCCFTLILIHCSVYGDRRGGRTVALSAIQGQGWYRHLWKSNSWVGDNDKDGDGWLAWGLVDPNAIVIYWKNGPLVLGRHPTNKQNVSGLNIYIFFKKPSIFRIHCMIWKSWTQYNSAIKSKRRPFVVAVCCLCIHRQDSGKRHRPHVLAIPRNRNMPDVGALPPVS